MLVLLVALRSFIPHLVPSIFGKLQLARAAWMAHRHGTNDAQKTMGITALALYTGAVKRCGGMKWGVVQRIVWAWVFTLRATGLIGYILARAAVEV